jgi:hypothetical protein
LHLSPMTGGYRHFLSAAVVALAGSLACAPASAPLPPPEEVLLLVNRDDATLQVIPVDAPTSSTTIPLGGVTPAPTGVSAFNGVALVPLGPDDAAAVVDLEARTVSRIVALPSGSGATGSAMVDDSIGYVANPNLNSITRINYLTGDTTSVAVGVHPQAAVYTRGKLFVLNGNVVGGTPVGPSWISVIDPLTNRPASGVDSILMPGPGNATSGVVAQDGILYVMNTGPADGTTAGRLTLVDPVGRSELGSFGGFGNAPGGIATNGSDRLYVSSTSEGLMVFDLLNLRVLRGAGNGVAVPQNSAVAVDAERRIYAVESGDCAAGGQGKVHILRSDLSEIRSIAAGRCAAAALVTEIPPQ